ncbi:MAG TPA: DegT/DnrJ/EryC1/StrS family aminotransferase [Candidatus Kapabacteria bacterium]|nr:DegT/DnrJ/EryC1/StrS family aminotransferase [Candidatus Kapabacteria bacterium]
MTVPLLDLKAQYASLKEELDDAVLRVSASQYFILGPEVTAMERAMEEYLEVRHALGVSSGTDALLLALMALGVGTGDEVIVPTFSFFATAGVVARLGAKPVLVDVEPDTLNIDPAAVARAITARTRAIVPVHLYGQSADMDPLMTLGAEHGVPVIEDAAQAIGVRYRNGKRVGSIGTVGCFSFFPSKNLGAFGDGGLVTTNDTALYERMKIMRVHGGERRYYHSVVGGNFRLDEIQAAVLNVKLPYLDGWSAARRANAARYNAHFKELGLNDGTPSSEPGVHGVVLAPVERYAESGVEHHHIFNQYVIRAERRDELRGWLTSRSIGNEVYYPVPFHLQECFADLGYRPGDFPVAEKAAAEVLALPVYPELTVGQIEYVASSIAEFCRAPQPA